MNPKILLLAIAAVSQINIIKGNSIEQREFEEVCQVSKKLENANHFVSQIHKVVWLEQDLSRAERVLSEMTFKELIEERSNVSKINPKLKGIIENILKSKVILGDDIKMIKSNLKYFSELKESKKNGISFSSTNQKNKDTISYSSKEIESELSFLNELLIKSEVDNQNDKKSKMRELKLM